MSETALRKFIGGSWHGEVMEQPLRQEIAVLPERRRRGRFLGIGQIPNATKAIKSECYHLCGYYWKTSFINREYVFVHESMTADEALARYRKEIGMPPPEGG